MPLSKEEKAAYQREYRSRHPERAKESVNRWRERNPDKWRAIRERSQVKWRSSHRQVVVERVADWRAANPSKALLISARQVLGAEMGVPPGQLPDELVAARAELIRVRRLLRNGP